MGWVDLMSINFTQNICLIGLSSEVFYVSGLRKCLLQKKNKKQSFWQALPTVCVRPTENEPFRSQYVETDFTDCLVWKVEAD